MITLQSISERSQRIKERLDEILIELKEAQNPKVRASEMAEEIAMLIKEQALLQYNLRQHEAMTEHLFNSKCSGPH